MNKKIRYAFEQLKFTRDFPKKLHQNFHCLTLPEKIVYLIFFRPFWDKEKRFFFEGHWGLRGQMYLAERQALYETIIKYKPKHCFEIGTYTGGGSTYFLTSAFAKLGQGKLITSESNNFLYNKAKTYYKTKLPELNRFVEFKFGGDFSLFKPELEKDGSIDCFLLDGSDISEETRDQYQAFSQYFKPGTIMFVHDWNTQKTTLVKPLVTEDKNWEVLMELKSPKSVGMGVFLRK